MLKLTPAIYAALFYMAGIALHPRLPVPLAVPAVGAVLALTLLTVLRKKAPRWLPVLFAWFFLLGLYYPNAILSSRKASALGLMTHR